MQRDDNVYLGHMLDMAYTDPLVDAIVPPCDAD
jgi:hypothetical protein